LLLLVLLLSSMGIVAVAAVGVAATGGHNTGEDSGRPRCGRLRPGADAPSADRPSCSPCLLQDRMPHLDTPHQGTLTLDSHTQTKFLLTPPVRTPTNDIRIYSYDEGHRCSGRMIFVGKHPVHNHFLSVIIPLLQCDLPPSGVTSIKPSTAPVSPNEINDLIRRQ
jgi:hypothetical protein